MKNPKEVLDSEKMDMSMDMSMGELDTSMGELDTDMSQKEPEIYDVEKESKEEIGETLKNIRANEEKFKKQLNIETDTDFYFQVVFKSPDDLYDFLNKYKIKLHHDDYIFFEDFKRVLKNDGEDK